MMTMVVVVVIVTVMTKSGKKVLPVMR